MNEITASPADSATIRFVPIDSIRPDPRNSRRHSDDQLAAVRAAMVEFGWTYPILADMSDGGLIAAGHGRLMVAQAIYADGGTIRWVDGTPIPAGHVPVIDCAGWTDDQRRRYVIADNRLAEKAEWDINALRIEIEELGLVGAGTEKDGDLMALGFTSAELDDLIPNLRVPVGENAGDPEATPEPEEHAVSQPGDLWILGMHRLICGDATDPDTVEDVLGDDQPQIMVTDPPYGVNYDPTWRKDAGVNKNTEKLGKVANDDRADWREAWRLFPGDVAYVWHAGLQAGVVADSLVACEFELRSQIIWAKDRFALSRGHYHWKHEPCWYAVRDGATANWQGDHSQTTVWEIPAREDSGHGHGTQKPVECMLRPVLHHTKAGDAVYEPFSGSGTTIIACERSGRKCLAVELDPRYVDVAIRRWQLFSGADAVHVETGMTFNQVSAARAHRDACAGNKDDVDPEIA